MDYRYGVFMAFGIPFLIVVTCWVAYVCGKRSVLRRKKKLSDEQRKTIMQTVFRIADFDESGEVDEMEFQSLLSHMTKKKDRPSMNEVQEVMMLAGGEKVRADDGQYHILLSKENFMSAITRKRKSDNGVIHTTLSLLQSINKEHKEDKKDQKDTDETKNFKSQRKMSQHLHISDIISDKRAYQWTKLHELAATWMSGAIQLLLVFHAPVSARAFYYFDCHKLGDRYFLRRDYQIECLSPEWNKFLPFALGLLFGFALAVPVALSIILCTNRQRLHTPDVRQRIGFLYSRFVPGAEWWEIHEVVRKMLLCGLLVYLPSITRAASAILICLISVATLNYVRPHKNRFLFWASQGSFLLTAFKYLTTIFAKAVLTSGKGTGDDAFLAYCLIFFDCLILSGGLLIMIAIFCMLKLDINNLKKSGRLDAEYDEETEYMVKKLRRLSKKAGKSTSALDVPAMPRKSPKRKVQKSAWGVISNDSLITAVAEKHVEKVEQNSALAHNAAIEKLLLKESHSKKRLATRLAERTMSKTAATATSVRSWSRNSTAVTPMKNEGDKKKRHKKKKKHKKHTK